MRRPGAHLRSIAARVAAPEIMERVIDPIIADLQCEYREARSPWRAGLSLVRSYIAFGRAITRLAFLYVADPRMNNPGATVARTWIVSLAGLALLTIALVLPPLLNQPGWSVDPLLGARLAVTLIPQALPLSIPAGLCIGVLWANRGYAATRRRLLMVLTLAFVCTGIVWVLLERVVPDANQMFRETMAAQLSAGRVVQLERGLNELGLSNLGQRSDPAALRLYHLLWALCFAAIPLSVVALGLARYVRRAVSAVAGALAVSLGYMACVWALAEVTPPLPLSPPVSAWLPNIVFLLAAWPLQRAGPRQHARPSAPV